LSFENWKDKTEDFKKAAERKSAPGLRRSSERRIPTWRRSGQGGGAFAR